MTVLQLDLQMESQPGDFFPAVLIVDDDFDHLETLAYRLGRLGFQTTTVTSTAAARSALQERTPHLILLDLGLPDGDGLDFCRELSDQPSTCAVPVIIVSGLDGGHLVRDARSAGARFFLRKPYDPNVLMSLIDDTMGDRPGSWAG